MKKNEIISYDDIFNEEGIKPIRGMYFDVKGKDYGLVLMNTSSGAKYDDAGDDYDGAITYEGHNLPQKKDGDDVTLLDQPMYNKNGTLTENGKFYEAAKMCNGGGRAKKKLYLLMAVFYLLPHQETVLDSLSYLIHSYRNINL